MLFSMNMFSQVNFWGYSTESSISKLPKIVRESTPSKYELFTLNLNDLKTELLAAPQASAGVNSDVIISFPNPKGGFNNFKIYNSPVLDEKFASSMPDINSYVGQGVDDTSMSIRFSITLFGLNAMFFSNDGTFYIDPYTKDLNNYIVYFKKYLSSNTQFGCTTIDDRTTGKMIANDFSGNTQRISDGKYRTFRIAISCTLEYATYHINAAGLSAGTDAEKKAAVVAAMGVMLTRVNGIYEKDLSVHFNLVNNLSIIYIASGDPYANSDSDINTVQGVIDAAVGNANYDIGHVLTTHSGLASLGVICDNVRKAKGTTGSSSPIGDPFFVDYVAHEIGHQFGANHSWSGLSADTAAGCTVGRRNLATSVEPGAGSTIMSYTGICNEMDVQPHSDDYFHVTSLAEMETKIQATNCYATSLNGNHAPTVSAGVDYIIPKGTPYYLKGTANDLDGDALTYCWEQTNAASNSTTQPPVQNATDGPNYRSRVPSSSPVRYMPQLSDVVAGNLAPMWEVTPTVARTMDFTLTVRDNKLVNGGQTGKDNMVATVDNSSGPFAVTSQNTAGVDWIGNSTYTVTWNVANTNALAANVRILLSTDGGATYPTTVLLASTPNDGTQTITAPNINAQNCRIFVEAVGNVFYNVSSATFRVKQQLFANATGTNITTVGVSNGTATATPAGGMTTATYNVNTTFTGAPFSSTGSPSNTAITVSTVTVPAIPAGAVLNSATLNLVNVTAIDPSYMNEVRVFLSGAYTLGATQLYVPNGAGTITPDPAINLPSFPAAGGTINLRFSETYNDPGTDATIGSAFITVSYTLNGYTYSWSNGATTATINNLAAGTYTVTVTDASGGTATGSYTVLNPLQITASAGANGTISPNGTAVVVSGNNQSYTISPNSGFNVQDVLVDSASQGAITTYTFNNVTANHTISATFAAIVNPSSAPSAAASQSFCQGATVANLSATGTALQWYNVVSGGTALATNTVLVTGNYYVSQTIGGVESSRTSVIVTIDSNCGGIPTSKVKDNQCGVTLTSLSANINADYVAGFQAYRFEVTNGATVNTVEVNKYNFSLTQTPGIAYGTTYGVRVAVKMGGTWGAYGTSCNVTTPVLVVNVIPTTTVMPSFCGTTLAALDTKIGATPVVAATGYRFEIITDGVTTVYDSSTYNFKLSQSGVVVDYGKNYTIRVAALVNGIYGNYGASCTVATPVLTSSSVPTTQIHPNFCGITLPALDTKIPAAPVSAATGYRFEITTGGVTTVYDSAVYNFKLSQAGVVVTNSTTYAIRVAVKINGVYGNYGASCNVYTQGTTAKQIAETTEFVAAAYPNPFETTFNIKLETPSKEIVTIAVYDMMGKLIETHQVSPAEVAKLQIGNNFTTGIYNVIVSQANEMQAIRLIRK